MRRRIFSAKSEAYTTDDMLSPAKSRLQAFSIIHLPSSSGPVSTTYKSAPSSFSPPLPLSLFFLFLLLPNHGSFPLDILFGLLDPNGGLRQGLGPSRMGILTGLAIRTETGQVERTDRLTDMSFRTEGT